ncbi:tetratricopeptide repeat-containing sulfotransferase family protein [Methylomagnum sp.]
MFETLARLPVIGANGHALAGLLQTAAGRYDRAIAHYETALARGRSWDAAVHHRLGLARLRAGDPAGAEPCLRRAMALASNEHWPCWALGDCLLALDRPAEAEQVLRKGLKLRPDERWWRHQLAFSLCRQDRAGEAIDHLIDVAAAVEPGLKPLPVPFPWYLLTTVSLATLNRVQALEAVVERHPEADEAIIFLARMEALLGRHEQATARLRQASALRWPDFYQRARAAGKDSADSKPPSFLIIGQPKAGTTALYTHLCDHPRFIPPLIKEPEFWSRFYAVGADWYRAHFPPLPRDSARITGDATATYFYHPDVPRRIAHALPNIKLVLILRDPVARAYSHYWMHVRHGLEQRTWEAVVDTELALFPCCPLKTEALDRLWRPGAFSYLLGSAALPHLQRWLAHFPREQLLILRTTELAGDLPGTLRRVCTFLDLPPFATGNAKRVNEGRYPPMAPATEQRLRDWFARHQEELQLFLANLNGESP